MTGMKTNTSQWHALREVHNVRSIPISYGRQVYWHGGRKASDCPLQWDDGHICRLRPGDSWQHVFSQYSGLFKAAVRNIGATLLQRYTYIAAELGVATKLGV